MLSGVLFVLMLIVGIPITTMLLNNRKSTSLLSGLSTSSDLLQGSLIGTESYITSARGSCAFFYGVTICSAIKPETWKNSLDHKASTSDWAIAWLENDSLKIHLSGLNTITEKLPANLAFWGSDASSGVNHLLNTGNCDKFRIVIFATLEQSNNFDFRCF